jgi:hypothetical protein
MTNQIRTISVTEFRAELAAQGVNHPRHYALKCPICGTVQSMASLVVAGASVEDAEKQIGFSCEGRITGVGPLPKNASAERRGQRGCDWSLGGLFSLHMLEVVTEDGRTHPRFEIASPEEAQELEEEMAPKLDANPELGRRTLIQELTLFDADLKQRVTAAGDNYSSEAWEKLYDEIFGDLQVQRNRIFGLLDLRTPDYYDPDTTYGADGTAWVNAHLEVSTPFLAANPLS